MSAQSPEESATALNPSSSGKSEPKPSRDDFAQEKREQIIEAALHCFLRDGFTAARIVDIAKQALVGKGTIYEYFRSKEELLLASTMSCCQKSMLEIKASLGSFGCDFGSIENPAKNLYQLLLSVLKLVPKSAQSNMQLFTDLYQVCRVRDEFMQETRKAMEALYSGFTEVTVRLVEQGKGLGQFKSTASAESLAKVLNATIDGFAWQSCFLEFDFEQNALDSADFLIDSILVNSALLEELKSCD